MMSEDRLFQVRAASTWKFRLLKVERRIRETLNMRNSRRITVTQMVAEYRRFSVRSSLYTAILKKKNSRADCLSQHL
jgi:hypothetical protein